MNVKQLNEYFPASFTGIKRTNTDCPVIGTVSSTIDKTSLTLSKAYEFEKVRLEGANPLLMDADNNVLACINHVGNGHVILTMINWLVPKGTITGSLDKLSRAVTSSGTRFTFMSYFLEKIVKDVLPLEVKGDIEYGLNKLNDGWLLYLINNKGIIKFPMKAQKIDRTKTAKVEVILKTTETVSAIDLKTKSKCSVNIKRNSFHSLHLALADAPAPVARCDRAGPERRREWPWPDRSFFPEWWLFYLRR